jgi:hypothetical protein
LRAKFQLQNVVSFARQLIITHYIEIINLFFSEENYSNEMNFTQYENPCEMVCMPNEQYQSGQESYVECDDENKFLPPCCEQCVPPPTACPLDSYDNGDQQNGECYDPCTVEKSYSLPNCCPCPPDACPPYTRRRYVQPPRVPSFKPIINYQRPTIPMSTETIYRKSFECVDPNTATCCRMPPAKPVTQLCAPCGPFEKETVTKVFDFFFVNFIFENCH